MLNAHVLVWLFVAAVFNGASSAEGSSWSIMVSERGTIELLDESEEPADSPSTSSELKEAVIFSLYTVSNPDTAQIIYVNDDDTLAASNFNASQPTRFVIHGWQNSAKEEICTSIREAYLARGDYNVIVLDWNTYARRTYPYARAKVFTVGEYLGTMVDYLETQGMSVADLIIIGHSLGAHLAGIGARSATNTVASVVGLDPAGPLFYFVGTNARLRSTDAEYVAVIHTNSALLGYNGALGDVDFWPNNGDWQKGCNFDFVGSCSHGRSYLFFAESIRATGSEFVAYSCGSYKNYAASKCTGNSATHMGGSVLDTSATGSYYLTTKSASPYAMG